MAPASRCLSHELPSQRITEDSVCPIRVETTVEAPLLLLPGGLTCRFFQKVLISQSFWSDLLMAPLLTSEWIEWLIIPPSQWEPEGMGIYHHVLDCAAVTNTPTTANVDFSLTQQACCELAGALL